MTQNFAKENPQYLAKGSALEWISEDKGETYNGCHFVPPLPNDRT